MANRHLEAVYVTRPVSIAYLTGFHADPHERLMALAVRHDGATLIVPALEGQSAAEHASNAAVVAWRDGEDPYELVDRALAGLTEVGVEKDHLSLLSAEVITSRTGVSELVDVGTEIVRLRLIKHEAEIEKLARAAAITDAACDAAFSRLRAGQSEIEIALMLGSLIGELGGTLAFDSLVQSGPNSAMSHAGPSSRKLAPGDLVLLDFGAAFDGYRADTTRMAVVGEPSERHREIHALVLEAPAAIRQPGAASPAGTPEEIARLLYAHPERLGSIPPPDPAARAKTQPLVQRLRGPDRDADLEARLPELPTPTLVLFGTRDRVIAPAMGRVYKDLLPSCHLVFVYDAGHAIGTDRPEAFTEVVADFLERREAFVICRAETMIHP